MGHGIMNIYDVIHFTYITTLGRDAIKIVYTIRPKIIFTGEKFHPIHLPVYLCITEISMPMPIGKGNIFSWIAPSFTSHLTILKRKTISFIVIFPITSQPHTLTHASQYIPHHLTASHTHTSQYITNPFTASHIYVQKYNPHCFTHISVHSPLLHSLTHSHPHTCISVHSPITSQPHTLTHLSTFPTASHTHTLAHVSQYIPHHITASHIWLTDGCIWQLHTLHTTLFKFTWCQPANQPSRNSVTCSCRLQAHTLPTHTLHTLTPSHSRVAMKV